MKSKSTLLVQYKSYISYIFFGICTTIINVLLYNLCYKSLDFSNIHSTIIAWFFAVLFAFVTNKLWVFSSRLFNWNLVLRELISFCLCRLLTGLFDVGIMWIAVDQMAWNSTWWKCISNVIVIALNYIASKWIIFNQ